MKSQIDTLAEYIVSEIDGEPSKSEGAGDTAIRLLKMYRTALDEIIHEIGIPQPGYPAPVVNAFNIANNALGVKMDHENPTS